MQARSPALIRFKTRREAESVLKDILVDGGQRSEFRIDEAPDGSCVIAILDRDGGKVTGMLGA